MITWILLTLLACQEAAPPVPEVPDAAALQTETEPMFAMQVIVLNYEGIKYMGTGVAPERTKMQAHELAKEIIAKAKADPDSFDELVYTYSDAPVQDSAGRTESFPMSESQGPFEYLKELEVGVVGDEPVSMPYGIIVARRVAPVRRELISGRHLVVPFEGSIRAGASVTRSRPGAKSRAAELHQQALANPSGFESLIQAESEAWDAERGGYLGTWWTETNRYAPVYEHALSNLEVGEISKPIRTEYGYELFQRVDPNPQDIQLSGFHILFSHKGAKASKSDRSKDEALALANQVLEQANDPVTFQRLAKAHSDDGTGKNGGDLGAWKLYSKLPKSLDNAFLQLAFMDIAGPVETEYGYHLIMRKESPQDRTLRYRKPTIREKPGQDPDHFEPKDGEEIGGDDHAGHDHAGHEGHGH